MRDKPFALQDVALPGTLNLSNGTLETIIAMRAGEGLPPMESVDFAFDQAGLLAKSTESDMMKECTQETLGTGGNASISKEKLDEILNATKGSRPDPQSYLGEEYVTKHLSEFKGGVTKIVAQIPVGRAGPPSGTFVIPSHVADELIALADGDISKLEQLLGLPKGSAVGKTIDQNLAISALANAVRNRNPRKGLIFHTDRGCQYASSGFRNAVARMGGIQSMSRSGNPYDNACSESFFKTLKVECLNTMHFSLRTQAIRTIQEYLLYYNRVRIHASLSYLSPVDFEDCLKLPQRAS